jgi:tetratricopeptide (TPR) repeat protein
MNTTLKLKPTLLLVSLLTVSAGQSALANPPAVSKVLQQVSQIMNDKGFEKKAAKLKQIITSAPSKNAYIALANLYMSENKNKEAIVNYQGAVLLDPEDPKLFVSMSIAYLHLGLYQMSKVMAEQAILLDPALAHAGKIIKYIDKKQEMLKMAAAAGKNKATVE